MTSLNRNIRESHNLVECRFACTMYLITYLNLNFTLVNDLIKDCALIDQSFDRIFIIWKLSLELQQWNSLNCSFLCLCISIFSFSTSSNHFNKLEIKGLKAIEYSFLLEIFTTIGHRSPHLNVIDFRWLSMTVYGSKCQFNNEKWCSMTSNTFMFAFLFQCWFTPCLKTFHAISYDKSNEIQQFRLSNSPFSSI